MPADPIEIPVHEIRKRCKEARGLGRLARPALGDAWSGFNAEVRDAAKELSSIRDAHAILGTIEDLPKSVSAAHADRLDAVRGHQEVLAAAATGGLDGAYSMADVDPPAWFGTEVTDDRRYTNAALALDGLGPDMVVQPTT